MRSADIAKGVDHRQDDEAKRKRNSCVTDRSVSHLINNNRPRSSENQAEGAEKLCEELLHAQPPPEAQHGIFSG
jgi:hypothetical protein